MDDALKRAALTALTECLNLSRKEQLLVVCDAPCRDVGQAFFDVGRERCREAVLVEIPPRKQNGNEPPAPVGEWFKQFDVAVMPTSRSLTHTKARREASEAGARIATLPGITADCLIRTMQTDWQRLGSYTRRVAAQLSAAQTIVVKTEKGTDLTFQTGGRSAKADDGRLNFRGAYGNLPAGEAFLAPLEGSAQGVLVIDGSFPLVGILDQPLVMRFSQGKVVETSGHPCNQELEELLAKYRRPGRNLAEFGVGTLDTAKLTGNVLEDEKVRGTVHLAIGDNASMGGKVSVPLHLDGVVLAPDVWLDGTLWMEKGRLVG